MYRGVDLILPLSDHADFDELVLIATQSGAQRIITMHGAPTFAASLRERGLNAEHLSEHTGSGSEAATRTRKSRKSVKALEPTLFD